MTSTSLICHISCNRFGKNGEQFSVLLVRQQTSQLACLCHKRAVTERPHWERCDNPHCDRVYEEDCCVIFALENPGKFCHWLRKSVALEQTAAVVYYSLDHFRNMSPLFSAKPSLKPRSLFIYDRNEISESSEVENEECLCLAHWFANCVLSVLSWERFKRVPTPPGSTVKEMGCHVKVSRNFKIPANHKHRCCSWAQYCESGSVLTRCI